MSRRPLMSGRVVDAALILAGALLLAPVVFVWLYPVFEPHHPRAGKITLRAGPVVEMRR